MTLRSYVLLLAVACTLIWTTSARAQFWSLASCGSGMNSWSATCWSVASGSPATSSAAPTSGGNAFLWNTGSNAITVTDNNLTLALNSLEINSGTGFSGTPFSLALYQTGGSTTVSGALTLGGLGWYGVNAGALNVDSGANFTSSGRGTRLVILNAGEFQLGPTSAASLTNDADGEIGSTGVNTRFCSLNGSTITNGLNSAAVLINDAGSYFQNEGFFSPFCPPPMDVKGQSTNPLLTNQNGSYLINGFSSAAYIVSDGTINNTGKGSLIYNRLGSWLQNGIFIASTITNDVGAVIANVGANTLLWNESPINGDAALLQNGVTGAATILNVAGATINNDGAGATFLNQWGGVANYAATINNDAGATFWNEGCIQVVQLGSVTCMIGVNVVLDNEAGSTFTNGVTGAATLYNDGGATFNNSGAGTQLNNQNGSFLRNSDGATINNDAGATLSNLGSGTLLQNWPGAYINNGVNSAATIANGSAATINNGPILANCGGLSNQRGSTLNNYGILGILPPSACGITGTPGNLSLGSLYNYLGATLNNAGTLDNDISTLSNSGTLMNSGNVLVTRLASIVDGLNSSNSGVYNQTAGYTLVEGTFTQQTLNISGGMFTQSGASIIRNGSGAGISGPDGSVVQTNILGGVNQSGGTVNIGCPPTPAAAGMPGTNSCEILSSSPNGPTTSGPDCIPLCSLPISFWVIGDWNNNGGTVNINANGKLSVANFTQINGATWLNGGTNQGTASLDPVGIRIQGGTLGGSGDVIGNVTIANATLQVGGAAPGPLHIKGTLAQTGGTVVFEIDSNGSGGFRESTLVLDPGNAAKISNSKVVFRFLHDADPMRFYQSGRFKSHTFIKQSGRARFSADALNRMLVSNEFRIEATRYRIKKFVFDPAKGATAIDVQRCQINEDCS